MFAFTTLLLVLIQGRPAVGQDAGNQGNEGSIDASKFDDSIRHWMNERGRGHSYRRFDRSEFREIADNLLKFQNPDGGWPKNVDWLADLDRDEVLKKLSDRERPSTCDNRNTYPQIEYLSRAYAKTGLEKYRNGAGQGLEFILSTQHESGGWRGADVDAITFNDDLMTGVMGLLLDIIEGKDYYAWITNDQRQRVRKALDRAADVTLRCQIVVAGERTGWCQQHDHHTLKAVKARSYELPSISAMETSGIVEFLMRIEHPKSDVVVAVTSAVRWLERSRIPGIRLEKLDVESGTDLPEAYRRYEMRAVPDANAPSVWARYYEIETNRPFFCNRNGIKVYTLEEVDLERRIGYAWYGHWPERILSEEYPGWLKRAAE
jgi:PelA/Pel-15E family pectate lyase